MRSLWLHVLLSFGITFVGQAGYGGEHRQAVGCKEVMPISQNVTLHTAPSGDAKLVPWRPGTCTLTAAEANDTWLRTDRGWIRTSDVVPCDRAIAFFAAQISRSPSVFALCSRSLARLDAKEYQAALEDGNEAVELDSADARGFFCRGLAAASMGDIDNAFHDFGRAITRDKSFAAAYNNRAMTRFQKGELALAVADCDQAILLDENYAYPYFVRARARVGAASDDPESISVAMLRRWGKDHKIMENAMGDIDEFIKRSPEDANGFIFRSLLWRANGDREKANADLQTAVRLAPACSDRGGAYCVRGCFAYEDNDYRVAIDSLNKAIHVNPRNADAYALRAEIWASCPDASYRNGHNAIESAMVACKLSHFREPWHIGALAAAYAETGDFDLAVKWQLQAVKMRGPDDPSRHKDEARLKLYRNRKPCRKAMPKGKSITVFASGIGRLSKFFVRQRDSDASLHNPH